MKFTIKKTWRLFSGFLIVLSKSPVVRILELSGLIADSTEWFWWWFYSNEGQAVPAVRAADRLRRGEPDSPAAAAAAPAEPRTAGRQGAFVPRAGPRRPPQPAELPGGRARACGAAALLLAGSAAAGGGSSEGPSPGCSRGAGRGLAFASRRGEGAACFALRRGCWERESVGGGAVSGGGYLPQPYRGLAATLATGEPRLPGRAGGKACCSLRLRSSSIVRSYLARQQRQLYQ